MIKMNRPDIVMEIGAGHGGSLSAAKDLIRFAAITGIDWVKLQTYHPDRMVLDRSYTVKSGPWSGQNLHRLYMEAMTPWEWHAELFDLAGSLGVGIFSTPFSVEDVALLETIGCPRYKIASFDIGDLDLIAACAATGKPLILSTGMASPDDILVAIDAARFAGCKDLTILACVSDYPADPLQYDLPGIIEIADQNDTGWGVSDHTKGNLLSIVATSMGARMIERHVAYGRASPDSVFALQPDEYRDFVDTVRTTALLAKRSPVAGETQGHDELRKSLYFATDLPAGETVMQYHLRACRPFQGIPAGQLDMVIGLRLLKPATAATATTWDHFERED